MADEKQYTTSSYMRAAQSFGQYKGSMYDFMGTEKIADEVVIPGIKDEDERRSSLLDFVAEYVRYDKNQKNKEQFERDRNFGIQIAENLSREAGRGELVSMDTIDWRDRKLFGGDLDRKEFQKAIKGTTYKIGDQTVTDSDFVALTKLYKEQYYAHLLGMEEGADFKEFKFDPKAWSPIHGERDVAFVGKGGWKSSLVFDEELAYEVGRMIYDARGGGSWSTWEDVLVAMDKDGIDVLYDNGENLTWEQVAPYIRKAESSNIDISVGTNFKVGETGKEEAYAEAVREAKAKGNPIPIRNYDIGPYQINTRWLHGGIGSFEKNIAQVHDTGWESADQDKVWGNVQKFLSSKTAFATKAEPSYTGGKRGFDVGDIFGKKSIFKQLKNKEPIVEPDNVSDFRYGIDNFEEKYEALKNAQIIDENFALQDFSRPAWLGIEDKLPGYLDSEFTY